MPSFDMLDLQTVRLGLLDESVLFEAYAFYNLFFGDNGKISSFYLNANNSNSTTSEPQQIPTDNGQPIEIQ